VSYFNHKDQIRTLRQLIGLSNVYSNYNHGGFSENAKFKMVILASKEVFATAQYNIVKDKGKIIISEVENLLPEAVRYITNS
jgi:hypothetical protein